MFPRNSEFDFEDFWDDFDGKSNKEIQISTHQLRKSHLSQIPLNSVKVTFENEQKSHLTQIPLKSVTTVQIE